MESLRKFGLLDADGKPLDERLLKALNDLLPRFRRRFPAIQDEVEITEVFEEAVATYPEARTSGGTDREASRLRVEGFGEHRRVHPPAQHDADSRQPR